MADLPDCCKTGFLHSGTPTGTEQKLYDQDVYVATPPPTTARPKKAIVICTDVFGWKLVNTRLIADSLAKEGFTVYIPDFFTGGAVPWETLEPLVKQPNTFTGNLWKGIHFFGALPSTAPFYWNNGDKKVIPLSEAFIKGLTSDGWDVASLGYCWGGRYTILQSHSPLIKCFATAHPSRVSIPSDIQSIKTPSLFLCAGHDPIFNRVKAENVMKQRVDAPHFEFVDYPGTQHGFAVRGNDEEEVVRKAREDVHRRVVEFFDKYL